MDEGLISFLGAVDSFAKEARHDITMFLVSLNAVLLLLQDLALEKGHGR